MAETRKEYKRAASLMSEQLTSIGKMPPQAIPLEESVLGALMLESASIIHVVDFLKPEVFYKEAHSIIYSAIKFLYEHSEPVDILTVTEHLKKTEEIEASGGAYYITQLTNRVASSANVEYHGRVILQKYIQRECIRSATNMIKQAYEDHTDVFELLDQSQTELNNLTAGILRSDEQTSSELFRDFISRLEIVANNNSAITGVPTTLQSLNRLTGGFQKTDLIIIAARPSMGKSASVKSIVNGAINQWQKPVLLFSLEMSAGQQLGRLLSEDLEINSSAFNSKEFMDKTDFNKINKAASRYFDKTGKDLLIIDDTGALGINELKARAKRIFSEHKPCCIIVDYLQKVKGMSQNRTQEIEEISWGLKCLAKELEVPVIALSQLNRKCEERKPPRPQLSDLRDSGAIEQDADMVIFLYRPEYYDIMEMEDGTSSHQVCEWIISKHRNGTCEDIKTRFIGHLTKFQDWDNSEILSAPTSSAAAGMTPSTDFTVTKPIKNDFADDPF